MDDEQLPRQPAMAQSPESGGEPPPEAPERDRSDHEADVTDSGDVQMKSAATEDDAAGSGPGAHGAASDQGQRHRRSFWRELPVLIVVALALTIIIKIFAIQAFYIPSSSMENTLDIGDRILVNKVVYHLRSMHRGDIVVFNGLDSWDPTVPQATSSNPVRRVVNWIGSAFGVTAGEKDYVKRIIGVPGDHVKCCDARGRITVNGVPLNEKSYLYQGDSPSQVPFDIIVPPHELWVMGDHRAVSYDSREHRSDPGGGSIPESKVIGRAFVVVWPLNRGNILPIPATFQQRALAGATAGVPLVLGFAGALPLTLIIRRIRWRRRPTHRPGLRIRRNGRPARRPGLRIRRNGRPTHTPGGQSGRLIRGLGGRIRSGRPMRSPGRPTRTRGRRIRRGG